MHPNPRRIVPIVLVIAIIAAAAWYFTSGQGSGSNGALAASGTIEGTQVVVAPEISGRVREVLVQEGDQVQTGQVLVRFDDALLQAQLSQAQAALHQAQANYNLVASGLTPEQRQLSIASAEAELLSANQALQALYDNSGLNQAQLQQTIATTDQSRDKSQQYLDNISTSADTTDVEAAWASVVIAQNKLENAQEDFDPYANKDQNNLARATLQAVLAAAQKQYDSAVERYNNIVGTANQYDLAVAQANVVMAEAKLADSKRQYAKLQDGIDPDTLQAAQGEDRRSQPGGGQGGDQLRTTGGGAVAGGGGPGGAERDPGAAHQAGDHGPDQRHRGHALGRAG